MGDIDAEFVLPPPEGLPPEVLTAAMRTHQKYFSCEYVAGTLAPNFVFVANNKTPESGKTVVAGNERVLRARLADARFFRDQDRKIRIEDRVEALKQRVYHDKLGSVFDKVERMEKLAEYLADHVPGAGKACARRAAHLAKADLSTAMVGEFPELQGKIGEYYYAQQHEPENVDIGKQLENVAIAVAIGDHYRPLGPHDRCPVAKESIVVALADKIDSLVGFYGIDEKPTGSRDPFALRRAALGIARIILENDLRISLNAALKFAFDGFPANWFSLPPSLISYNVLTFIVDRLKIYLRERGVRSDLIAASVYREPLAHDDDLVRILIRQATLASFLNTEDGANLLIAYRRASNIVAIEERRDRHSYNEPVDPSRLEQPEESALWERLSAMSVMIDGFLAAQQFDRVMGRLATLRQPVDEFFDKVTVNTDDAKLRENRLRLLSRIRAVMNQVADFSQIEG
jgi:glycyl-tRNA synthetase beta chain